MSDIKYSFCPRTFANLNGLSKHMIICVKNAEATGQIIANNSAQICNYSKPIKSVKQKQKDHVDINEYYSNNIKFRKVSKQTKSIEINSSIDLNSTYAGPSGVSNTDNISDKFAYMSIELDESNNASNSFDLDPTSGLLDKHETAFHENQEFSNNFLNNSAYTDDIQASSSDEEIVQEFSNEAYADLMVLVTKYKLSNIAGNAIISFFNKHSKYSKSPLPKNIKQGKEFINNIKSNLSYKKTKVLELDNTEYFLYYMDLISCIESKLEIPDIVQHLEFEYKELYKTTENGKEITYKEQNNGMWWKTIQNTLPVGSKLLSIVLYSDATNCDTLVDRKNLASIECSKHDLVLRNHKNMRNYFENKDKNSVCIESIPIYFWNFK
ncbi:zn-finger domain-containing protein [Gigaspora margarita]|uniref:Zn-finger domain-containing protein n=1 Tax=Gigaspora margarita TaxID=4874 RepID=A0A8H3X8T3_GIGMA|nr:zn-finger domain-containing protein [Gigaspora margarita]